MSKIYLTEKSEFEKLRGSVSDSFDTTKTYAVGDYCIYENVLYKCITEITEADEWDSTKWESTTLASELDSLAGDVDSNTDEIESLSEELKGYSQDLDTHTKDTNNPHNITKELLEIGNVENKSSETIRGEITSDNVTKALGYKPYTPDEVDNKFSTLETNIDWKESVATFSAIATTYPNPKDGWTVNVNDTDITYRYNGSSWVAISANSIPKATTSVDGLMTKEMVSKLEGVEEGANNYVHPEIEVGAGVTTQSLDFGDTIRGVLTSVIFDKTGHATFMTRGNFNLPSSEATTEKKGLMSPTDKTKLEGVAEGANKYTHPSYTARTGVPTANATPTFGGSFKVSQPVVDASGHVSAMNERTITIPSAVATQTANGLMSASDKTKVDTIDTLTQTVEDLGKSVADGKELLATTISDYGYSTVASDATFEEIDTAIDTLATGKYSDGYKKAKDIFYPNGGCRWTTTKVENISDVATNGKGTWVVVGVGGAYYSTDDGKTWTKPSIFISGVTFSAHSSVAFDNNMWLISTVTGIYFSTDAITWTLTANTSGYKSRPVYHSKDGYWYVLIATSQTVSNLFYSTDNGKKWTSAYDIVGIRFNVTMPFIRDGISSINDRLFVSAGSYLYTHQATTPLSSSWINAITISSYTITYANGVYIAGTSKGIYTSTTGNSWTVNTTVPTTTSFTKVMFANGICVAISYYGVLYCSKDNGATWFSVSGLSFWDIHYANGVWVGIVALNGVNDIAVSFDGFITSSRAICNDLKLEPPSGEMETSMICGNNGTWLMCMGNYSTDTTLGYILRSSTLRS